MEIRSANVLSYRDNSRDEIDRCMIRKNFADMCKEVTQFKKNGKRQKPQNNNNKHKRCKTSLKQEGMGQGRNQTFQGEQELTQSA